MYEYGHWVCSIKFDPDDWFGFIYRVTHKATGKQYIGRKQFASHVRKKVKNRKNRKRVKVDSKWQTYTTSSKYINDEILEGGKEQFEFEIIELCKTKGDLTYREIEIQWEEKVLEAKLPDGTDKYYNKSIGNIRFTLSDHSISTRNKMIGNQNAVGAVRSQETRDKISKARTGMKFTEEHRANISKAKLGTTASTQTTKKQSETMAKMKWFTNGVENIRLLPEDDIPDGFEPGRNKNWGDKRWYNNGVKNIRLDQNNDIPDGFALGMLKKDK